MGFLPVLLLVGLGVFVAGMSTYDRRKKKRAARRHDASQPHYSPEPLPRQCPEAAKSVPLGSSSPSIQLRPSSDRPFVAQRRAAGSDHEEPISPLAVFHGKSPLTQREASCYWSLTKNLEGHYIVLPQVAFSAFLFVDGADTRSNFRRFATMRQKVADFLIVRHDFSIVALIELDDRSHDNKQEADRQRDAAIKQAGIRVFRIPQVPHSDQVQRLCEVLLRLDQQG